MFLQVMAEYLCGYKGRVSGTPFLPRPIRSGDVGVIDPALVHERREPVLAMAGIARPERFFDEVRATGWQLARGLPFADHHPYTTKNLSAIAAAVREVRAALVLTTEKDAVRLEAVGPLPFAIAVVPMRLELDPPETLQTAVRDALAHVRYAAAARAVLSPFSPAPGGVSFGDPR